MSTHGYNPLNVIWARLDRRNRSGEGEIHRNDKDQVENEQSQQAMSTAAPCCRPTWSFVIQTLLCGTHDPKSPLCMLKGFEDTLLRYIYEIVMSTWIDQVTVTLPAYSIVRIGCASMLKRIRDAETAASSEDVLERESDEYGGRHLLDATIQAPHQISEVGQLINDGLSIAFCYRGKVVFPPPQDINVHMLPFILGDKSSLPDELHSYYPLIEQCRVLPEEMGKVCYVTVCESHVQGGATQGRVGLHIKASRTQLPATNAGQERPCGVGAAITPDEVHGGSYMASNVPSTYALYNALVDKNGVDSQGGMNHLRRLIGAPTLLEANELVWLTDCTPREALPQAEPGYRQFFRLVTSKISLWYEGNSTVNPKVPLPGYVQVIPGRRG